MSFSLYTCRWSQLSPASSWASFWQPHWQQAHHHCQRRTVLLAVNTKKKYKKIKKQLFYVDKHHHLHFRLFFTSWHTQLDLHEQTILAYIHKTKNVKHRKGIEGLQSINSKWRRIQLSLAVSSVVPEPEGGREWQVPISNDNTRRQWLQFQQKCPKWKHYSNEIQ